MQTAQKPHDIIQYKLQHDVLAFALTNPQHATRLLPLLEPDQFVGNQRAIVEAMRECGSTDINNVWGAARSRAIKDFVCDLHEYGRANPAKFSEVEQWLSTLAEGRA